MGGKGAETSESGARGLAQIKGSTTITRTKLRGASCCAASRVVGGLLASPRDDDLLAPLHAPVPFSAVLLTCIILSVCTHLQPASMILADCFGRFFDFGAFSVASKSPPSPPRLAVSCSRILQHCRNARPPRSGSWSPRTWGCMAMKWQMSWRTWECVCTESGWKGMSRQHRRGRRTGPGIEVTRSWGAGNRLQRWRHRAERPVQHQDDRMQEEGCSG